MTDNIQAEYVNFKTVVSRKTLQIILEVPIEAAPQVFKVLGMPATDESRYVTVTPYGGQ